MLKWMGRVPEKRPLYVMVKAILIADDNEDDAQLLTNTLATARSKNPVFTVPNGVEVVKYLEGYGVFGDRFNYPLPSVILLDLKMPGLAGIGVLEWLQKQSQFKDILVIVVSGLENMKEIDRAYKLGARSFIPKPCTSEDIKNVAEAFQKHWD